MKKTKGTNAIHRLKACAGIVAAVMMFSACGASSSAANNTAAESQLAQEVIENYQSDTSSVDLTESAYIDEISVALSGDLADLSPWGTNNSNGRGYTVTSIYETLLTTGMEPCLAESYEQVDNHTYDFKLYENIYDTEGNHMTASDVVFSMETCLSIGSMPPVCAKVVSAEELDEYTVRLTLVDSAGIGDIENVLYNFFVVTQAAWEASPDNMVTTPVGTSHYRVTDFVTSSSLTVEDTQNYWQTEELTAPRSRANVKTIHYYVITESAQRTIALQNGTVDFAPIAYSDRSQFTDSDEYVVNDLLNSGAMLLVPNTSEESPLNDENLRKAVFYAIDNAGVSTAYATAITQAINGIGSPYYSDYDQEYFDSEAEENYYGYSIEKAQEYLAAAGYEPGELTLQLFCQSTQSNQDTAAVIQGYLMSIGINVEISAYDNSVVTTYLEDPGIWDLYISSYRGDESWVNITETVFNPEKFTTGGTMNFIFDDTLQEMMALCRSSEGHTSENVRAYHDYIVEHAYLKGLLVNMSTNVANTKFAGGFVYQDTNSTAACIGASTFNEA